MKILWVNSSFLHPTTRGGQIRTLEMLRRLHARHEVHYAALANLEEPEGVARAGEYCSRVYPVAFHPGRKDSPGFALQLAVSLISPLPLAVSRWRCAELAALVERLACQESYDCIVCDFLVSAVNCPVLERAVLFEHNVETVIWERRAENTRGRIRRIYFHGQARRMSAFEAESCRRAKRVVAVSEIDAATISRRFGVACASVPTGVDIDYFRPPAPSSRTGGLVFVGSMDWMPNIDGIQWFLSEVLPLIRARRREARVTVVGRTPPGRILSMAESDPLLYVTGTVPDVRPYLWKAGAAIVPLRIGGGTRLKIYEAMAAGAPVVSTSVGAEGLAVTPGQDIWIADEPAEFAERCIEAMDHPGERRRIAEAAAALVESRCSWEAVTIEFERLIGAVSVEGHAAG
jgi:glycosyltransferase involved in cell wall biosynthesis